MKTGSGSSAGEDILKDYFDGEAGHITVRVKKDALEGALIFDAAGVLNPARIAGLVPDPVSPVYFCFDKEPPLPSPDSGGRP